MTPFVRLTAIAAALPIANIDTDMIVPAAFLKTISRKGLAEALFYAARVDRAGQERADFVLNRQPWRKSGVLITLGNIGCGSSREHAPWALLDFGIRCIIAPSFADIFHSNCFKNGILPIVLDRSDVDTLLIDASDAATATLTVDLEAQEITRSTGAILPFCIDPERRKRLLKGLDDIALSLAFDAQIARYEAAAAKKHPWIHKLTALAIEECNARGVAGV